MDLTYKVTLQLRPAEVRELEAEAAYFRDRAVRAEDWLAAHSEGKSSKHFFRKRKPNIHPETEIVVRFTETVMNVSCGADHE